MWQNLLQPLLRVAVGAQIERVKEEFLLEVELAQKELKTLREHVADVALEHQIMRSAAGEVVGVETTCFVCFVHHLRRHHVCPLCH